MSAVLPAIVALAVAALPDPTADDALLATAEEVLAAHIAATGGAAAYASVETRWESGRLELGDPDAPADVIARYVAFMEAPNRRMTQIILDGDVTMRSGCDGSAAWRQRDAGAELEVGDASVYRLRWASLERLYRWRDLYERAELTGIEEVDGRRCYRVALYPSRGDAEIHFFDVETALLARVEEKVPSDGETTDTVSTYDDWREVDGILQPHRILIRTPDRDIRQLVEQVRDNIAIPAGTFDAPAEVRDQLAQVGDPASVDVLPEPGVDPVTASDTDPVIVWRREPDYPGLARLMGIEGRVVLRAVITRHGKVTRIETERAPLLDLGFSAAARGAAAEWRYAPATVGGEAVDVRFSIVVDFRLDGDP